MIRTCSKIFIPISAIILLALLVNPVMAQSPITATVDRNSLTTDDTLMLTVSVSGDEQPMLPSLKGFNLLGSGTSSQISIINGSMSTEILYNYYLQPAQPGQLTIDPVSLTVNGQTYTTQPITVQVSQGTGQPGMAPRQAMPGMPALPSSLQQFFDSGFRDSRSSLDQYNNSFVEAEVSDPNPFLGEPLVYTFRFYREMSDVFGMLDQPQYNPPAFGGFWTEEIQDGQNRYQAQDNAGRIYEVTELTTVVVPTKLGEVTIEPGSIAMSGGFFSSGGKLVSEPITINVKPLPAGAPTSFGGGVGQFTIEGSVDTSETKVNEPITWRVVISGRGNVNTAADPIWPVLSNWRNFESEATVTTEVKDGQISGSRIYEQLLVPQVAGHYTIPSLEYSYFNPNTGQYETVSTRPIEVNVAPGAGGTSPQAALTVAPLSAEKEVEQAADQASDIRYLKPVPSTLSERTAPITDSPLYWLAWTIPLVGLGGNFMWQRRQAFQAQNAHLTRRSKAARKANKALVRARQLTGDDIYGAAGQALFNYLSDKLDQPVLGLTQVTRTELLAEKGVTRETIDRVNACLSDTELGRFSPDAGNPAHASHLIQEIQFLIRDLEKVL